MSGPLHSAQTVSDGNHVVTSLEATSAANRAAGTVTGPNGNPHTITSADVGRVLRQTDNDSFWLLTDDSPLTWVSLGSSAATAKCVVHWGNDNISASTTQRYLAPGYDSAVAPTAVVEWEVPFACTAKNLRMRQGGAGNGNNIVYTVQKNGTNTAITVTLASTGTAGADTTNSVSFAAGDRIGLTATKATSVGTSPSPVMGSLELDPT